MAVRKRSSSLMGMMNRRNLRQILHAKDLVVRLITMTIANNFKSFKK
jgi:hypothetical protein